MDSVLLVGGSSPSYANSEGPLIPVSTLDDGHLPSKITPRSIQDLMLVTVFSRGESTVGVAANTIVGVCVSHRWDCRWTRDDRFSSLMYG